MAYTKAPTQDTYQTKQIPLVYEWDNRKSTETSESVVDPKQTVAQNVFFELIEKGSIGEAYYYAIKRSGTDFGVEVPANILGMHYWVNLGRVIVVTATNIYQIDPLTGIALTTATGAFAGADAALYGVNFTEFLYENGTEDLIIASGSGDFGTYTQGGVYTPCTDPDRPSQIRGYPVFLDGYLFFTDLTGNIYNSDLNLPLSWSASNLMSVESYPDITQAIARAGNYIVALGTTSIEWFYDAANPTGTPLARVDGATQQIGYLQGLISTENAIYFVGRANQGTPSVYKISGLKITEVGSPTVRRWLNTTSIVPNSRGHIIINGGHRFYTVVQNRNESGPTLTYMMDLDNGMWSSLVLRNDTEGPYIFTSTTVLKKDVLGRAANAETWFSEYQTTSALYFASYNYSDYTSSSYVNFTCKFTTRPLDFGNYRTKFVSRLVFGTDKNATSTFMQVSWSDDDYSTFSTPRPVNLANVYAPLWACGAFRKRIFQITYADDFPMRWASVEIDYNQGGA